MEDLTKKLEDFIRQWSTQHGYFDENGTLHNQDCYDVGYDLKADIESSPFNDAPVDGYDFWFDLFLEDHIIPILLSLGAAKCE